MKSDQTHLVLDAFPKYFTGNIKFYKISIEYFSVSRDFKKLDEQKFCALLFKINL